MPAFAERVSVCRTPMSDRDRLAELLRQRALIQEHLAWLDRLIAETSRPKSLTPPIESQVPLRSPPLATALVAAALKANPPKSADEPAPAAALAADSILEEYRVAPSSLRSDVRKGCLLYFAAALALVALVVTALWFALRRE